VGDLAGDCPSVLVIGDPEAFLAPPAAARLLCGLEDADFVLPVSNEAEEPLRDAPPWAYPTPTLLERTAEHFAKRPLRLRPGAGARASVFAASRSALSQLPPGLPMEDAPREAAARGRSVVVDPGAFVHRYGDMDASSRCDLADLVPAGARSVLDVGCARGTTAAALRQRGVTEVFGIEPDSGDADAAKAACDQVFPMRLEEVRENLSGRFDAILFGDVLEHLEDPAAALEIVRPWLSGAGVVVASVPNVGHWSVVLDLLEGRFDYVPYSILSGTHVRFFTRSGLADLFEAAGFRLTRVETVRLPPPPFSAESIARLRAGPGASPDLDVAEFLLVARRDDPFR
jgi:2-polyprenyl-3-methyl-5-hydroxy-6-metoxy-1,4-benzoquinol methylase